MFSFNSYRLIVYLQTLCKDNEIAADLELFQIIKIGTASPGYLNTSHCDKCKVVVNLNTSLKGWKEKFLFVSPTKGEFGFSTA